MFSGKNKKTIAVVLFVFSLLFPLTGEAKSDKVYRIGYFEAGSYWIFSDTLKAVRKALGNMGWKDKIEFSSDIYFSPGWGDDKKTEWIKKAEQIMNRKDIDLVIAAGTDAVRSILEVNNGRIPIIGMCVSDPLESGFVTSEKDSGIDNFTVRIVPDRFKRMFGIFHTVVGFKKLGLMYPDTESGRIYANVEDARQMAKERGFKILEYKKLSAADTTEECLEGLRWLVSQGMNAFFIPPLNCFDWKLSDARKPLDFLVENKIPTFARQGTKYVKAGALMGFSSIDFSARSEFIAEKIIKILQGNKPRSLPMVDRATPRISLNLFVAERIGFRLPFDIISASDELFQEIILPEDRRVR